MTDPQTPHVAPPRRPRISPRVAVAGFAAAAAGALLLIALILVTDGDPTTAGPSPSPSPSGGSASPSAPSPSGSDAPSPQPTPVGSDPTPVPGGADLPIRADGGAVEYRLAAAPNSGIFVLMSAPDEVILTQLDPDGTTRDGWPQRVPSPYCVDVLAAPDGSVRALCDLPLTDDGLQEPKMRLLAWEADGTGIAGWPVDVAGARSAALAGDSVAVEIRPYGGDTPPPDFVETVQLALVGRDGSVRAGEGSIPLGVVDNQVFLGPTGTGYLFQRELSPDRAATQITAFGLDGPLDGWPIEIAGASSDPSFDTNGRIYVATGFGQDGQTRVFAIEPDGVATSGEANLGIELTSPWSGAGDVYPWGPFLGGPHNFLVSNPGEAEVLAVTLDGTSLWGYHAISGIQPRGECNDADTGCGVFDVSPAANDRGVLYLVTAAPDPSTGGSILVALGTDGDVLPGWPVELTGAGSEFWDVVVASDGGVWALAVEPESNGASVTLLSIAPDSTVRGTTTIVEP